MYSNSKSLKFIQNQNLPSVSIFVLHLLMNSQTGHLKSNESSPVGCYLIIYAIIVIQNSLINTRKYTY